MSEDSKQVVIVGRTFEVMVYGNDSDELERAALAAAREAFGDGPQLEIRKLYKVTPTYSSNGPHFQAVITVREILP